jgi:hypothetical protein
MLEAPSASASKRSKASPTLGPSLAGSPGSCRTPREKSHRERRPAAAESRWRNGKTPTIYQITRIGGVFFYY